MKSMTRQLLLNLYLPPALTREDFLQASCNQEALKLVEQFPGWPTRVVCLFGDSGCGKTHLAKIWQGSAGAFGYQGASLGHEDIPELATRVGAILVDGADVISDARILLHLMNVVNENKGFLMLTSKKPPVQWAFDLPDLTSRLHTIMSVGIHAPDEALLRQVMIKLCHDQQIRISLEVIDYCLKHMERSFKAAQHLVVALNKRSLASKKSITLNLAKEALGC